MSTLKVMWLGSVLWLGLCNVVDAVEAPRYKLLLQVSEDSLDKLNLALNNAKNAQNAFGPENIEIEIVVFDGGIQTLKYYTPALIAEKVKQAAYSGVRIVVCEIALHAAKLRPSDMLRDIRYVTSGVAEIVEKATQGWVYIKP